MQHPPSHSHEPSHGLDLAQDIDMIRLLQRRRALGWLAAGAGSTLLGACGGGGSSSVDDSTASTTATTSTSTGTTTTTTSTSTTTTSSATSCLADPQETPGPYPADGTNTSEGSTSDALTATGIVRSDIRSSFISSTTVAQGVEVVLTLTLLDSSASCAALADHAIYLWQCDESGNYSLYGAATESYLRGVQVTDANGQVTFTTIFPACYAGRYPHMHIEVFTSLATATTGKNALLTTQLAMPVAECNAIYPNVSGYAKSVSNYASVSTANDLVFGTTTAAQLAVMTPTMTGSVSAGYTAVATLGLSS